ncbi:hypothetical protein EZV62_008387 [Acer yangbiense]|uniref:Anticodon-binding domain-containing protein n=1 Tax=Acer yangbiense TaxID=1000413 RepID=A0A5C7IDY4_9ROSI|nr:hypothetical protein EZV62_008387 [Acer yangbiense]
MAAATEESLRCNLADMLSTVESQVSSVMSLKASKAPKTKIDAPIEALNRLNHEKYSIKRELQSIVSGNGADSSVTREAFRQAVVNTLERRKFYFPSFQIYGGVAGLYDFGRYGSAVKSNVLSFWKQHFVLAEDMSEVQCTCVTPEPVLKASGHVDKFTDVMVKDEKTGTYYRADHLLKDFCKDKLEKDRSISAKMAAELKRVLATLDDFSAEELGAKIKEYGITAPYTKNPLSDPYPFNLMFPTSIGPSGLKPGYMRPETAQGLLRQREFTLAEIEHFVDPEDKSHPKYSEVVNLEFLMFPREEQMSGQSARNIPLGEPVSKGIVNSQTLGYFIGRVYLFLTCHGIDKKRLRFRQHLANEMAHYAIDCWDAEIESSYGWIECVGIADRSTYDLKAHSDKSGVALVARKKFSEPREVEKLVIVPVKKELGPAFKGNQKNVVEALEAMNEKEAMDIKAELESKGEEKKKEHQRVFTPSVIEPSFGIDRIIYCLYEHSFYTRPSKAGDEQLNVFRFLPFVAPIKCTVLPLVQNQEYEDVAKVISKSLTVAGISHKIHIKGTSIGKRYAITDELRVPFAITVDSISSVTIRERDSKDQIRVQVDEAASVVKALSDGHKTWEDIWGDVWCVVWSVL